MSGFAPQTPQARPWYLEWAVIVVALICFWPVGLVLLVMRIQGDRSLQMGAGNLMFRGGIAAAIIAALVLFSALESRQKSGSTILFSLLFLVGGAVVAHKGYQAKKAADAARRYIDLIVNQRMESVDSLASAMQRSDVTGIQAEVQDLINRGFLPGFVLDPQTRLISRIGGPQPVVAAGSGGQVAAFKCKGCGANNSGVVAVGGTAACEYCGTANAV